MGRRRSRAPAAAAEPIAGIRTVPPVRSHTPPALLPTTTAGKTRKRRGQQGKDVVASAADRASILAQNGVILLLFESPSGFAIFCMNGRCLERPDAIETVWTKFTNVDRAKSFVWLKEFQTFKDKSSAINPDTGVNSRLADMILKWHVSGQKVAVGKPEYKRIIETSMGIPCMCDGAVMEVLWGLKNVMHTLLPQEKSELNKEDCLQMSQGLKMLLDRYGFDDVKPEMVNECIISTASDLYDYECSDKQHFKTLFREVVHLQSMCGINFQHWGLMKLATALKIICHPQEKIVADDPQEMFTPDELSKLVRDAHKYEGRISKRRCSGVYKELVLSRVLRTVAHVNLASLVRESIEKYEAEQRGEATTSYETIYVNPICQE